ncbi:ATP-dependent helicase [Herbiconiux sp. KACC 21604]|uniref:ATP-dependent helicase n=1 Tax=unclassified Herbiconiux TaxID=2618217 RepID=UPI0014928499|nr:ATP-dependent helicase [Herbiconiux sp. SALV-R1]QJU53916.1 ATP-dependent helicase [Herbiconiux sp. SALV-R1]WPO84937.1 ATP-dependent helicase [Herbiconiux sp. KACC 21604]
MTGSSADDLLTALDPEQSVAARALLGPVCILAGAGTGKTRAITHRIAYGVATGVYSPNRVMALTFTSRAAAELRSRLRPLGAGGVAARTFHAAALSQLNYFWPQVVGGEAPKIIDNKAKAIAHAAELMKLRVDTATLRDIAAEIEWRKVSNLSIEEYGLAARTSRTLPSNLGVEQMLELQQRYEALKDERRQLDFEDVLLATAGMIELEPSVAIQVREQYRFFVVDEFQDVSPLQHHLLELWLGTRRDLCVVGDASQTIYSFAGASADYLLGFERRHPSATVVSLERNYRSTEPIVAAANRLMRGRPGALTLHAASRQAAEPHEARTAPPATGAPATAPPPTAPPATGAARAPEPPEPVVTAYRDDLAEAAGVAARIAALVAEGVAPNDIAVLYRVNSQSAPLEQALTDAGVSYQLRGGTRFFDQPDVKRAVMELRAASVSITEEPLFKSVSDVLRSRGWTQHEPEGVGAVRDRWESLNAIMGLAESMPAGTTFREFTDELMARQASQHEPTVRAVNLATLHSAKGLEWPVVFIVGVAEGLIPISHASGLEGADEERRLLYVGITRARERLELSWAAAGVRRGVDRQPSRFLQETGIRTRDEA